MDDREEKKPEGTTPEADREQNARIPLSAAARRVQALGLDREREPEIEVEHVGFWENFWYHHKWKTILIAAAALIVAVCMAQLLSRETPDAYLLYAGPAYLTAREVQAISADCKLVMEDSNGDGKKGLSILDINYLTAEQIEEKKRQAQAEGVDLTIDGAGNTAQYERFELEMIAGESAVCLLDPALYENVRKAGGLVPLSEVFAGTPPHAVDEYGIAFGETDFARTFSSMNVFPQDSILCLRRVTSVSRLKGKKAERLQAWQTDFFTAIVEFTAPDGVE